MVPRLLMLCVGLSALHGTACGQQGQTADSTTQQSDEEFRAEMRAAIKAINAKLDAQAHGANAVRPEQGQLQQAERTPEQRITALEEHVATLLDEQKSGQEVLQKIVRTDKDGNSFLRMDRIDAGHEPTRKELRNVIEAVAPTDGVVIINNKTNENQWVAIDDQTIFVLRRTKSQPFRVEKRHFIVRTSNNVALHWGFEFPKTRAVVDIVYAPYVASR